MIERQLIFSLFICLLCSCGFKTVYDQVTNPQTTSTQTLTLSYPDGGIADVGNLTQGSSQVFLIGLQGHGSGEATVSSVSLSTNTDFTLNGGAFPTDGGSCQETITGSCSIAIQFAPTFFGRITDLLTIQYTVNDVPYSFSVMIQGTGI